MSTSATRRVEWVAVPLEMHLSARARADLPVGAEPQDDAPQATAAAVASEVTGVLSDIVLALATKGIVLTGTIRIADLESRLGDG